MRAKAWKGAMFGIDKRVLRVRINCARRTFRFTQPRIATGSPCKSLPPRSAEDSLTKGPYEFELTALRQPVAAMLSPASHCQKTSSLRAEKRQMP